MASIPLSLPPQFIQRAATTHFIVELETYFTLHMGEPHGKAFAQLPVPPDHLDRPAVEDCRAIAAMLALACKNIFQVSWDAEEYANDVPKTTLPNPDVEARLMVKYRPLISHEEMLHRHEDNLLLLFGPGIVADMKGRALIWSLPEILSESLQAKILRDTRILEAQLTVDDVDLTAPPTKDWRTAHTFYWKGLHWTSGSTRLSPAGFERGSSGLALDPAPSVDARSTRIQEWMRAFQETGGMLDGILAVTHPELYRTSQDLMIKVWHESAVSRPVLSIWPLCFTAVDVIVNRSMPGHRNAKRPAGWFDVLLTLGTYGKKAVLELRGLGISLPYNAGSVVPIMSTFLVHGVPEVRGDRICYALSMNGDLYARFKIPIAGMATVSVSEDMDDGVDDGAQGLFTRQTKGMLVGFSKPTPPLQTAGPSSEGPSAAHGHLDRAAEVGDGVYSGVRYVPAGSAERGDVEMADA